MGCQLNMPEFKATYSLHYAKGYPGTCGVHPYLAMHGMLIITTLNFAQYTSLFTQDCIDFMYFIDIKPSHNIYLY